jgi:hypothetical protein
VETTHVQCVVESIPLDCDRYHNIVINKFYNQSKRFVMILSQLQLKEQNNVLMVDITLYKMQEKQDFVEFVSQYQKSTGYYYTKEEVQNIELKVEFYSLLTSKYLTTKSDMSSLIYPTTNSQVLSEKTFQTKEKFYDFKKFHFDFELPIQRIHYQGDVFSLYSFLAISVKTNRTKQSCKIPLEFERIYENYAPVSYDILFEKLMLAKFIFQRKGDYCHFYFSQMSLDQIQVEVIIKEEIAGKTVERIFLVQEKLVKDIVNFDFGMVCMEHPEIVPQTNFDIKTTNVLRFKFVRNASVLKWEIPLKGGVSECVVPREQFLLNE